jgi:hypothetical protein
MVLIMTSNLTYWAMGMVGNKGVVIALMIGFASLMMQVAICCSVVSERLSFLVVIGFYLFVVLLLFLAMKTTR